MLLRSIVLIGLPLATVSFLFPSSGGGCCCNSGCGASCAPSCAPVSSCGGGCSGGFSGYSGGYSSGFPSYSGSSYSSGGSYAAVPQASYAQPAAPIASYAVSAPQASYSIPSVGGYAKSSYSSPPSAPSYNSAPASSSYNAPSAPTYNAPSAPTYNAPSAPQASQYNSDIPPPPPSPPSEVAPSSYTGHAAASGDKLQTVEEEEANAGAELSAVAASLNSTVVSEPSPPIDVSLLKLTNDTECNSEELREIITQNMTENLNSSKRLIQIAAEEKFGGRFDVICSTSDFSYVTNTELFCQHTVNHVSCYSYRQL